MKYLFLVFVSTSAFALEIWIPNEKQIAHLEWKIKQSPQEKLARKFSKFESMDIVREFKECEMVGLRKLVGTSAPQAECINL